MKGNDKIEFIINMRLEMIFSEFRKQEGIGIGPLTEVYSFDAIDIYRVLMNRQHKKYNSIETSDLEEVIADEAGKLIRAYVKERYNGIVESCEETGKDIPKTIPYPNYDITLDELKKRTEKFMRTNSAKH